MTKNEQIKMLKDFQAIVPKDTYLEGLLTYIVPQFESDTRSDFPCCPEVREIEQATRDAEKRFQEAVEKVRVKKAELTSLEILLNNRKGDLRAIVAKIQDTLNTLKP
jgi:hypothetical protein